jgi:propanediol dehydratase small subunit
MNTEELVRQVMAEVMANLGGAQPTYSASAPSAPAGGVTAAQYPLGEKVPDKIKSASGKALSDFSLNGVVSGALTADDFRTAPQTLEMQAQVAESVGRDSLARNLRRAAELIAVPDEQLLSIYNALRPYRSTKAELLAIADELEQKYRCTINAAFVREAAAVYEARGRLKSE